MYLLLLYLYVLLLFKYLIWFGQNDLDTLTASYDVTFLVR